jgi:hypothetical protein
VEDQEVEAAKEVVVMMQALKQQALEAWEVGEAVAKMRVK